MTRASRGGVVAGGGGGGAMAGGAQSLLDRVGEISMRAREQAHQLMNEVTKYAAVGSRSCACDLVTCCPNVTSQTG